MRADENPGRAGSPRTSGEGPSAIATDFPSSSSMVTMRRTDLVSIAILDLRLVLERRAHHDERHQATAIGIGPAMPIAELHDDVAGLHHDVAAVEQQGPLAFKQDAVSDGGGLVDRRAEENL